MSVNGSFLDKNGLTYLWSKLKNKLSLKQDVLSFDAKPMSGSTNPVTSGGVYTSQQSQDEEILTLANFSAKNILNASIAICKAQNPSADWNNNIATVNGVSFEVNSDGSITVNSDGTQTGNTFFYLARQDTELRSKMLNKELKMNGCPSGGSASTYRLRCWHYTGTSIASDNGNGSTFTFTNETDSYDVSIQIYQGTVCNNLLFKPMIRYSEITDATFVPYAPTNRELYEMILALQNSGS